MNKHGIRRKPAPPATDRRAARAESFSEWAALAGFRQQLADHAARREQAALEAAERARQAQADAELFRRTVGEVSPLKATPALYLPPPAPPPLARQTWLDERAVLREALSDSGDPDILLEIDETLSFRRNGIGLEVVRKLRRGHWVVQAQVDLHGLRRDEAREALQHFVHDSQRQGLRCVRVIHGKGLGSVNREPVLRGKVRAWLTQKNEVLAFCEARDRDGGAGAVLVLLRPARKF